MGRRRGTEMYINPIGGVASSGWAGSSVAERPPQADCARGRPRDAGMIGDGMARTIRSATMGRDLLRAQTPRVRGPRRSGRRIPFARASRGPTEQDLPRGFRRHDISSGGGLADRYAAALYAHAEDLHALDTVVSEMDTLGRLIDASADFRRLLESPLIDVHQARRAALAVLDSRGLRQARPRLRRRRSPPTAACARCAQIVAAFADPGRRQARHHHRPRRLRPPAERRAAPAAPRPADRGRLRQRQYRSNRWNPTCSAASSCAIGARLYDTSLKSRLQRLQYAMKGAA